MTKWSIEESESGGYLVLVNNLPLTSFDEFDPALQEVLDLSEPGDRIIMDVER